LGEQRDLYNSLLSDNKSVWSFCQKSISPGSFKLQFDPLVKACMNASFEKASWENLQRKYASDNYQWTFVHNDSHPGNFMWNPNTKSVLMIDMELMGIG